MRQIPEGYKIIIVFALAGVIIAMAIILLTRSCCTIAIKEGFDSSPPAPTSCPGGSKSFYDANSNVVCCDGIVNGRTCEGTVVCSFSHSSDKYPSCNTVKRYKYNGPINPFVAQIMNADFVSKFGQGLAAAEDISKKLKSLPTTQISADDSKAFSNLLSEEKDWYNQNKNSSSIDYQRETMYIIVTLTDLFRNKPIVNNKEIINQHLKDKLCTPDNSASTPAAQCPPCPVPTKRAKKASNPTGYVISGTDIQGEIPVKATFPSPGGAVYVAQNGDRIVLKEGQVSYSFPGNISKADITDTQTLVKMLVSLIGEARSNGTFISGNYNVRKL